MLKRALAECENEFSRLLNAHSKPIDLRRLPWPLPERFGLNYIFSYYIWINVSILMILLIIRVKSIYE